MAYEKTQVPVERTQGQIKQLVMGHGGTGVAFVCNPPMEGFHCILPIDGATYTVRIEAKVPEKSADVEQCRRIIWRVLFFHLKSTFEASESGVLEFRRMMLPYIVTGSGETVADKLLPVLESAIERDPRKMLTGAERPTNEER